MKNYYLISAIMMLMASIAWIFLGMYLLTPSKANLAIISLVFAGGIMTSYSLFTSYLDCKKSYNEIFKK
jgi:hypothetical protein